MNEDIELEVRRLRGRIHELETKLGWYKAVNTQLRDDLIQANLDFQELARITTPPRAWQVADQSADALDAIVLSLKREADARKPH